MENNELEKHRISAIQTHQIAYRYPRLVGYNARRGLHGQHHQAQIQMVVTDQGAVGWGLSTAPVDASSLVGCKLSDLFVPEIGVIAPAALPLDFALHDLAGVILGQPVWEMLGAQGQPSLPCYDGAIYMDDLLPEDNPRGISVILESCLHDYALGYRAFKLKIGRGHMWMEAEAGLQRDIEVTRLVRKHFPHCEILVDANDGYTCEGIMRYLDAVADCQLFWVEEPFPENREDLLRLRDFLSQRSPSTLIADGEREPDIPRLLDLASEGLVDVLLMDIAGLGFTNWRKWMPAMRAVGVYASPHAWGNPLKTCYAAQLGAGLGNVLTVEGVPGTSEDADWTSYQLGDGLLQMPKTPGFGISLAIEAKNRQS